MTRSRIALVSTELGVGGAERCLTQLAVRLNGPRWATEVYSIARRPDAPRDGLVRHLEQAGIPIHFLDCSRPSQFLVALRRLRRHWQRQRPDVVQSFLFHANVLSAVACRRLKRPRLSMGIRVADPSRWRARVERWAARRAAKVVCVSQSIQRFAEQQMKLPPDLLTSIPNGVDVADESQHSPPADLAQWGVAPARLVMACVGRLEPQKGLDQLLPVLPPLMSRFPNLDLLIIGEGSQRTALEATVSRLGLVDRVLFLGWQPEVAAILRACALLLLPSRWEGMPNVVLEAMAVGIPVAAHAVEGVGELLGPLTNAQTASRDRVDELVEIAGHLIGDAELRRRLGAENQRRVQEHFAWPQIAAAYGRLFDSLLSQNTDHGH